MHAHVEAHAQAVGHDHFKEIARQLFGRIRQRFFRPAESGRVTLSTLPLGNCQLTQISAPAHGVLAAGPMRKSFENDSIKVLVQLSGRSRLCQGDRKVQLRDNSVAIYDPTQEYRLLNATSVDQLILQAPRSQFDDRLLRRLKHPVFVAGTGAEQSQTLAAFMRTTARMARAFAPDIRVSLGHSLTVFTQGIISEAFCSDMVTTVQNGSLLLLRERILEFVDSNIANPDLTIDEIARRMGCTPRYLHKAFEQEAETLQRYIQNRRLEYGRRLLSMPASSKRPISEIAYASGFNSSAHFCRVFKQRFELTPGEMREGHARAAPA